MALRTREMTTAKSFISEAPSELISKSCARRGRPGLQSSWPLWPAQLFALTLFIPYGFSLGDLVLSVQRVLLLICMPLCILSIVRQGRRHWVTADSLLVANAIWIFISFCVNHGLQRAVVSGGIYSVEMLCPYLLARLCIVDARRFAIFAKLTTWMAITLLLATVPECSTGFNFFRAITGEPQPVSIARMGLYRTFGPFAHPILCGVFCSTAFAFSWYVVKPRGLWLRYLRGGLIFLATATSLASGALLCLAVQVMIIAWDATTRKLPRRWVLLVALLASGYLAVALISNRSATSAILSYVTLDAGTAYTRMTIWDYGSAEVLRHPVFGIGLNEWQRPNWLSSSIDNYWLATAVRYGFPGVVTIALAMCWLVFSLMRVRDPEKRICSSRMAWISVALGIAMAGGTVHIWGTAATYFSFFLGMAGWMLDPTGRRTTG